jgi:predicted dithiol-disulfide oxidoreductase (DUF899 family)
MLAESAGALLEVVSAEKEATMTEHKVGTREEWLAVRTALLAEEKELTRRSDELARKRQALPWVPVENDHSFETDDGRKRLADLFGGRLQLLVYHFMFGPTVDGWPDAGCPGCSSTADSLDGAVAHLPPRGVTFVAVSRAPLENPLAYRRRMGWSFPWVSAAGSAAQAVLPGVRDGDDSRASRRVTLRVRAAAPSRRRHARGPQPRLAP